MGKDRTGGGGSTFIPTFSYHSKENFLVRCDMTGSYLTHDGGQSYQQINFEGGASSYAYDPKDSNIIYTGSVFLNRSADGGKTWQKIFPKKDEIIKETFSGDHAELNIETTKNSLNENKAGNISNIRVDAISDGNLYFSMSHFFFYTKNNGLDWEKYECVNDILFIYGNTINKNEVFIFTTKEK